MRLNIWKMPTIRSRWFEKWDDEWMKRIYRFFCFIFILILTRVMRRILPLQLTVVQRNFIFIIFQFSINPASINVRATELIRLLFQDADKMVCAAVVPAIIVWVGHVSGGMHVRHGFQRASANGVQQRRTARHPSESARSECRSTSDSRTKEPCVD